MEKNRGKMTRLTKLANEIGIDKGTTYGEAHGFTEFYSPYFEKIKERGEKINILEVGVQYGGSLRLYNEFFGQENCEIYGLDIDPSQNHYETENVHVYFTNQNSLDYLKKTAKDNFPGVKFDIIIDDGGHEYLQQFNTLLAYYPLLKEDGIFIIEDLHTNVDMNWGNYVDSPLNFLISHNKSSLISYESQVELVDNIDEVTIYKRKNPRGICSGTSITSIITFKKK